MSVPYQPDGYPTASPYLSVDGASQLLAFLAQVFDATEGLRVPDEQGRILHAETRIGDSVIMMADSFPGYPPMPSQVHVFVPDVDATYQRALAAGATSVQEPMKKSDPDRRGGVKDPCGVIWWISTRVE